MTPRTLVLVALLVAGIAAPAWSAAPVRRARVPAPKPAKPAEPRSRTLEDIHIEGEIPVPQVLFITARDQRRFMDFQQRRYLRTSRKVGEDTPLPSWIVVTGLRPTSDKETPR